MWMYTKDGFFSAVQDRGDDGRILVRSRIKEDIEKLASYLDEARPDNKHEILVTPDGDYGFRMSVLRAEWKCYLHESVSDLDYFNFKSEVHGEPDRDQAYMQVWSAMNDLQHGRLAVKTEAEYIGGKRIG